MRQFVAKGLSYPIMGTPITQLFLMECNTDFFVAHIVHDWGMAIFWGTYGLD